MKTGSIHRYLLIFFVLLIAICLVPITLLGVLMPVVTQKYNQHIQRIVSANEIIELTGRELEKELWELVAGNVTLENAEHNLILSDSIDRLSSLSKESESESKTYLEAALRMTSTLGEYTQQLETQISKSTAVFRNQSLLREIRSATKTIEDILQEYISAELRLLSLYEQQISVATRQTMMLMIVMVALIIMLAVSAYRQLNHQIRSPIQKLQDLAVQLADGNLEARAQPLSVEELEGLTTSLNTMADQMQSLIDSRVANQKNLRKSEMRTLQAQIAPHFVYNTLDAIVWLAQENRQEEVIDITMALTNFFRISLSKGSDWIPVEREIQHIYSYLRIQAYRYGSILQYEIDVEPALNQSYMLKLLLQPLVENAIYHGLKLRRGRGFVRVTGRRTADGLMEFTVQDNGVGMDSERLAEVREGLRLTEVSADTGFGLYNVNKRIQLYYDNSGLTINSEPGEGTCISFSVPFREGDHVQDFHR